MSAAGGAIQVTVNGDGRGATAGQGLLDFLAELGLTPAAVLVERNGQALLRHEWAATLLAEGDRLEILRVVAGG